MAFTGPVLDAGDGGSLVIIITGGTDGTDVGAIVAANPAERAALVEEHNTVTDQGPFVQSYDPELSALLAPFI